MSPPSVKCAELRVVSLRSVMSRPGSFCDWHGHNFEELCLSTDGATRLGQAGEQIAAPADALFYYRRGVTHGYWNAAAQAPRFWVLHFVAAPGTQREFDFLRQAKRAFWSLTPAQVAVFKHCYLKLFLEHTQPGRLSRAAESAWLRLLLIEVQRWSEAGGRATPSLLPDPQNPEVLRLWQLINECVPEPGRLTQRLQAALPNYDSLRHAFKTAFGCAPRQMLLNLRMQQAKNLLLETPLSIKAVAAQVGYPEQHEFTRTFRRLVGVSPSQWRRDPTVAG